MPNSNPTEREQIARAISSPESMCFSSKTISPNMGKARKEPWIKRRKSKNLMSISPSGSPAMNRLVANIENAVARAIAATSVEAGEPSAVGSALY